MTVRRFWRAAAPVTLMAVIGLSACDHTYTGVPYRELGRDMAGVYNPTDASANLGMRLVLGTRHSLSGRFDGPNGLVRFQGTWVRNGDKLTATINPQEGLPSEIVFDITREKILTEIQRGGPFDMTPENAPAQFFEQDIMRLRTFTVVAGVSVDLNLVRVITDVTGGSGGPTQASITPSN